MRRLSKTHLIKHLMKEEREERMKQDRVKHQAQRRPATGRLLCLIFCWQAGGGGRAAKRQADGEAAGEARSAEKTRRLPGIASRSESRGAESLYSAY